MDDKHELTRVVLEPGKYEPRGLLEGLTIPKRLEAWIDLGAGTLDMVRLWVSMMTLLTYHHTNIADALREVAEEMEPDEFSDRVLMTAEEWEERAEERPEEPEPRMTFEEWDDRAAKDQHFVAAMRGLGAEPLPDPPFTEAYWQSIWLAHKYVRTAADSLYGTLGWTFTVEDLKLIAAALDEEIGRMKTERGLAVPQINAPPR